MNFYYTLERICSKIFMKTFGGIYAMISHVGYARWIGVNMGEKIQIYGNPSKMFGSEPWLITLGNNVHITTDVLFITHDGGTLLFRDKVPNLEITAPIVVSDNVYIGVRSVILPGVTIGENSIIAAGSIVTKDVPSKVIVGGVPAKVIKTTEEYFEQIQKNSIHLGHLKGKFKDRELKKYFNYKK